MNRITPEHIKQIMDDAEYAVQHAVYGKVCIVTAKLKHNGFTIVGTGSCVDPSNYDIEMGIKIAKESIESKLWELEGYMLQTKLALELNG